MKEKIRISKADRLFGKGLEKLSDELRAMVLERTVRVTKIKIMILGADDTIPNKSITKL